MIYKYICLDLINEALGAAHMPSLVFAPTKEESKCDRVAVICHEESLTVQTMANWKSSEKNKASMQPGENGGSGGWRVGKDKLNVAQTSLLSSLLTDWHQLPNIAE